MSISLLLEMAASSDPDRTAVVSGDIRLTTTELSALADGGAGVIAASGAQHVAYVGTGGAMLPLLLFSSARAAVPVTPLNYRLSADGLRELIDRLPDTTGSRRRRVHRRRRRCGKAGDLLGRVRRVGPHRRACRRVRRPRRCRRRAVHVRHHVATQGRRADPQQPDELCHRHRGVRIGLGRRCGVDLRSAVSHRRRQRGAVESVRGPKDGVSHQVRPVRVGSAGRPTRASPPPRWCRRCSIASSLLLERTRTDLPTLRNLAYGGSKVALPLVRKALVAAARRRFRQRLRPHRDELDDRGAHARRSPRGARRVGRGGGPTARFGRSTGTRRRGADPGRRRHCSRHGRDRRAVRPRRPGVGPLRRNRFGARRRGLVPDQRRCHA